MLVSLAFRARHLFVRMKCSFIKTGNSEPSQVIPRNSYKHTDQLGSRLHLCGSGSAPIQVRTGPYNPPLCVSPRVCPSDDAILLPSSAIRHAMAPLRPAQAPCRLRLIATGSAPFPPLRSGISGHRSSSRVRALLSAAPSPETPIPPLSLALPRLPSHVPFNTCCERPLPSLPSSSPGTRYERGARHRRRRRRRRRLRSVWVWACAYGCCWRARADGGVGGGRGTRRSMIGGSGGSGGIGGSAGGGQRGGGGAAACDLWFVVCS